VKIPVLPTRDAVLLPGAVNELNVGRPGSVAAIRHAVSNDEPVLVLLQKKIGVEDPQRDDLHEVGSLCRITSAERTSTEAAAVRVKSEERVRVLSMEKRGDALLAEVEKMTWAPAAPEVPESLSAALPFMIEIGLGQRRPGLSVVEQLCYLSVVAPIEAPELQRVLESADLSAIVAALASLRDESWLARFLRWIRK
jgi:Lon protease-like protein